MTGIRLFDPDKLKANVTERLERIARKREMKERQEEIYQSEMAKIPPVDTGLGMMVNSAEAKEWRRRNQSPHPQDFGTAEREAVHDFFVERAGDAMLPGVGAIGTTIGKEALKNIQGGAKTFKEIVDPDAKEITRGLHSAKLMYDKALKIPQGGDYTVAQKELRKQIVTKTGWWKGLDNQWRYEISDAKMNWKIPEARKARTQDIDAIFEAQLEKGVQMAPKGWTHVPAADDKAFVLQRFDPDKLSAPWSGIRREIGAIGDLIEHEELFKFYPKLADVKIYWRKNKSGANVNGIQRFDPQTDEVYYEPIIEIGLKSKAHYMNDPDKMKSMLLHESQHIIQEWERFALGGNPDYAHRIVSDNLRDKVKRARTRYDEFLNLSEAEGFDITTPEGYQTYLNELDKRAELIETIEKALKNHLQNHNPTYKRNLYYSLMGEAEARAAQARQHLTRGERRERGSTLLEHYESGFDSAGRAFPEKGQIIQRREDPDDIPFHYIDN